MGLRCGLWVALIFFGCAGSIVKQLNSSPVDCLGNPDADNTIVYLHGLDTEPPGPQELENRKILAQLAEVAQVRIALPRGSEICGKLHCWGWNSDDKKARLAARGFAEGVFSDFERTDPLRLNFSACRVTFNLEFGLTKA